MSNIPDEPQASTARRTLQLVELLLASPAGLAPHDLLAQLDLSRSTLFLLLNTLKGLGYVEQAEKRGRYRAGPRLLAWRSSAPGDTANLTQAFYQEAERRAWRETLALLAPAAGASAPLVLAQVEGSERIRAAYVTGQPAAGMDAARQALAADPPADVRTNGYALAQSGEAIDLALPVCRDGHHAEAVLALSAPAHRWTADGLAGDFLAELRAMAARLSYRLGAPFYAPYRFSEPADLQPTTALAPAEIDTFLAGPWTARLACIRPDGHPHVIPVWQEWDGQGFHLVAWQGSQWAAFARQNPHVSLTVDEPWPPLRRVTCRGLAQALPADFDLPALAARLARRYLGQAGGPPGQIEGAFRVVPEVLRGYRGLN